MSHHKEIKRSKFMTSAERFASALGRFNDRTDVVANEHGFCWLWNGPREKKGYVRFRCETGQKVFIHRWAYELFVGPIPEGLTIDHLCRNTGCANPWHLEPVTDVENIARGTQGQYQSQKTHCRAGHEFTPENTYTNPEGHRSCRICNRINGRRGDSKRKGRKR